MANSHFCLSNSRYKNNVFKGFSQLQQSDEFVDMTLAAGDQYVKVHKTLIVLASPYIKALLQTIPCQHPVLLLSNVKGEDLHLILEYIYSGEVNIPPEKLESFLIAAQAMHISGLESIELPAANDTNDEPKEEEQATQVTPAPLRLYRSTKRFPVVKANITINENDFNLQVEPQVEPSTQIPNIQNGSENNYPLLDLKNEQAPEENVLNAGIGTNNISNDENSNNDLNEVGTTNNLITSENIDHIPIVIDEMPQNLERPFLNIGKAFTITNTGFSNNRSVITVQSTSLNPTPSFGNIFNIASKPSTAHDAPGNNINNLDSDDIASLRKTDNNDVNQEQVNEADGVSEDKGSALYTLSSRGSLQLIINRFMYYSHYTRDGGRKRRWRCIEYRGSHCQAAIDTDGETIVARKQKHAHPNHDKKIWNKVVKSRVFPTLKMAQDAVKEKQSLPKPVAEELVISD